MEEMMNVFIDKLLEELKKQLEPKRGTTEIELRPTDFGYAIRIHRNVYYRGDMPFYWYGLPQDLENRVFAGLSAEEYSRIIIAAYRKWWMGLLY